MVCLGGRQVSQVLGEESLKGMMHSAGFYGAPGDVTQASIAALMNAGCGAADDGTACFSCPTTVGACVEEKAESVLYCPDQIDNNGNYHTDLIDQGMLGLDTNLIGDHLTTAEPYFVAD